MQVSVLASGSKGNSIFVEAGDTRILVDAGISARRIKKALGDINVSIEDLNGILITHEHRDHIGGLKTLTKNYHVPIYTREDTFQSMYCVGDIAIDCFHAIGEDFKVGNLNIRAFNISHDAADPVGYSICQKDQKCTIVTDLGFVSSSVQAAIDHSNLLVLEANHDLQLLKDGTYPWSLKQRILSNRGHLSNSDAAWALVRMQKEQTGVILAHLSEENNRPEVAQSTVCEIVERQGFDLTNELAVHLAKPSETVTLFAE